MVIGPYAASTEVDDASIGSVVDPVCDVALDPRQAAQTYDYHQTTYYFHSADCFRQFLDDPEKYSAPDDT
ncbi:MAG: YHS domain-containing protein [Candidatus Kerfeldbacteria bacterium]|nr:YHS domain-containing protein [Candidatus Kerfeldbacteria bacterium]